MFMISLPSPGGSDAAAEDAQFRPPGHVGHRHLQRHRALDGQLREEERLRPHLGAAQWIHHLQVRHLAHVWEPGKGRYPYGELISGNRDVVTNCRSVQQPLLAYAGTLWDNASASSQIIACWWLTEILWIYLCIFSFNSDNIFNWNSNDPKEPENILLLTWEWLHVQGTNLKTKRWHRFGEQRGDSATGFTKIIIINVSLGKNDVWGEYLLNT